MNSNYFSYNNNSFNKFSNNTEQTAFKSSGRWTPDKKENFNYGNTNNLYNSNDNTVINTNLKFNYDGNVSVETPEKIGSSLFQIYESSIMTPIKKSKRRDCTPLYSSGEQEVENYNSYSNNYNEFDNSNNIPQILNFGSGLANNANYNISNNYNLLKMNNSSINSFNPRKNVPFQKLSTSKFLDKINNENSSNNKNNDMLECSEILDKIRGNYLLNSIESDVNHFSFLPKLFSNIVEDSEVFNKITNLICHCIFEGFNNHSDIFFKLLSQSVYLEIVDQPMDSFNNNLVLLMNHVLRLDPNYSNYQVDLDHEECKYAFSLGGTCKLKTENEEILNFIISFIVCFNLTNGGLIRSESVRIEDLISVDYIKIKIFN